MFAVSSPELRRGLSDEPLRFALAVIASDPLGQIAASARNVWRQLTIIDVFNFRYDPPESYLATRVPEPHLSRMRNSASWRGTMPVNAETCIARTSFVFALLYIVWIVTRRRSELNSRTRLFVGLIVLGVFINAAMCGA
ncbi:MAG TPA: hypothetical protein VJA26_17020, partial [Gammaproteobacteria bacterium]|nr:hypothetical protein [Gammaproteobacteria bacterium]